MPCPPVPALPIALAAPSGCCCPVVSVITLNTGALFLANPCAPPSWSPGSASMPLTSDIGSLLPPSTPVGDSFVTGALAAQFRWVYWSGTTWVAFIGSRNPSSGLLTTSWIRYLGPSTPCDPRGTYSSPFTTSVCAGASTYPSTVSVS